MKIFFICLLMLSFQNLLSQIKPADTSRSVPFDINKIKNSDRLSTTSEIFSYDSLYIWNDKRSLSEIMETRPGYFINDFGLSGRNLINFNGSSEKQTGILRDGIQINDDLFGGFDVQNFSINEIDRIEDISGVSSFFYGVNSNAKAINVITKDIFQTRPFSQLRYSQDRFNSLYADLFFGVPFSKKINFMAGATKHSIDPRYENQEFDSWRGRTRLSFYLSPKLNIKLNFNYTQLKRGLNEGLIYNSNEDSLESSTAPVVNILSNEELTNYYYNADITAKLFKNNSWLTKLKVYSINSLRSYDNSDTSEIGTDTVFFPSGKFHQIQYAADLKQNFDVRLSRDASLNILAGGNYYYNLYNLDYLFTRIRNVNYSLSSKADLNYKNLFISGFVRMDNHRDEDTLSFVNYGAEAAYILFFGSNYLKVFGGINNIKDNDFIRISPSGITEWSVPQTKNYFESGFELILNRLLKIKSFYFENVKQFTFNTDTYRGINSALTIQSKYIDLDIKHNYWDSEIYPKQNLKSDLSYHNIFFRNKLNIRVGIIANYSTSPDFYNTYSQYYYDFYYGIRNPITKSNFTADIYLGARIGRANINITVANIFNSLSYNTYVYPLDNRGGLLNAISRFTIVWDFIN